MEGIDAFIFLKVEIWSGDTDVSLMDSQTLNDRATQLLISIRVELS